MHFTPDSFRAWPTKRITLLGMSGVGKTHISTMLRGHDWFHFSGDYRIGTRYLDEPILDLIKQQAMQRAVSARTAAQRLDRHQEQHQDPRPRARC